MRISSRHGALLAVAALLLGAAVLISNVAFAGEETAPAAKPAPKVKEAPKTAATEKPATATPSPIHSILKWVGSHVLEGDCACPSTAKGEKAWRAWFVAKDAKLSSLRDSLVKDGWNADRTVGFFKKMAASKSCSDCDKGCNGCDKKSDAPAGAAAPAGDAGKAGSPSCNGGKCPCTGKDKADCAGCDKANCPCNKNKDTKPAPAKPEG